MGYIEKSTINYIKELRKVRDLPKIEKLKHMLKFKRKQEKLNEEEFFSINHSLEMVVVHNPKNDTIIKIQ